MNETIITVIISTITGIVTFFFGVSKTKKEVESMALTNIQTSLDIYKVIIDDLKGEIETLLVKVDQLEKKIKDLEQENKSLHMELKEILREKPNKK